MFSYVVIFGALWTFIGFFFAFELGGFLANRREKAESDLKFRRLRKSVHEVEFDSTPPQTAAK